MPELPKAKGDKVIQTYTGENSFLRRQELKKTIEDFVSKYGDFALEKLDGDESTIEQIKASVTSMPFLAERKLVVIYRAGNNKDFSDNLDNLVKEIPENTDLILDEPKLDKRTAYYKWVKAKTDFKEFSKLDDRRLVEWMVQYAKLSGGEINRQDALYLVQRVGGEQQRLANELDKLTLLEGPISRSRINDLTEPLPQSKIFDLLDAAFSGDHAKAMILFDDQRAQRVEPQEILAMIGWQLRQVALVKTAGNHDLIHEAKMSPYTAEKASRIASRMTLNQLKKLIRDLIILDVRSKRSSLDLDQSLRAYILSIVA